MTGLGATRLFDPELFAGGPPHEHFRQLRIDDPCHWSETPAGEGCWNIVRHADVVAVLKDWTTYSSHSGGTTLEDQTDEQILFNRSLLHVDPPEHTRMRRAFAAVFGRREAGGYAQLFESIAEPLVDEILALESFDAVGDLAAKMAGYSLWELLGGHRENRDYFIRLSALMLGDMLPPVRLSDYAELVLPEGAAGLVAGSPSQAMLALLRMHRASRVADGPSIIKADAFRAAGASELEIEDLEIILATAGTGMTQNSIVTTLYALACGWDGLDPRIRSGGDGVSSLTEEGLRVATPLMYVRRTATSDHVLGQRTIRAGDKVVVWLASANFDEHVFLDPLRFDATRDPNPHVSFGRGGPHFCLGAWLAREEIAALLRVLLRRVRRIDVVEAPVRTESSFVNEIARLRLSVEAI